MSVIKKMRKMRAVWWSRLVPDGFGKFSFAPGVEVRCRWDDKVEEFRTPTGQTEQSHAVVYVDREMLVGDRLRRGTLESVNGDDPLELTDAFEIRHFAHTPNFKCRETLYTAYL